MIDNVLTVIETAIRGANPTYVSSFVGGRLVQDGKIIKYQNREGEYQGLSDTNGNYFYIRYDGLINANLAPDTHKMTSCLVTEFTVPVKLVSWVNDGNNDKIAMALLYDLNGIKPKINGYSYISSPVIRTVEMDREAIIKAETKSELVERIPQGLSLVAIQFGITVMPSFRADCIDRDFCNNTC